jgi:hypothetical protein
MIHLTKVLDMIKNIKQIQLFGLGIILPLGIQPTSSPWFIYEFVWLIFASVNLLNLVIMHFRFASIVRESPELKNESKQLMVWLFAFGVLPFLLLYLFQYLGGFHNAFYAFSTNYHNPYVVLGWSVFILLDIALLYSILWGGGASTLIRFRKAFRGMPDNETQLKILTALCSFVGTVSLYFMIASNTFEKTHS